MAKPILRISDGTTTVDLLALRGWLLQDWEPAVPEPKGGGIFRDSPLVDGRKLAFRKLDNITDTFNLVGNGSDQNALIRTINKLEDLLKKGVSYWLNSWQNQPVWIEAKGSCETETRYATIVDYRLTGFGSPYKQPFFSSRDNSATEAILVIEHTFWQETVPGQDGNCVRLHSKTDYAAIPSLSTAAFYPNSSDADGTYAPTMNEVDLTGHTLGIGLCSGTFVGGINCQAGIIFDNVTIPAGATIISATLNVVQGIISIGTASLYVNGQTQVGGIITGITVTNAGYGYLHPPIINIIDTTGSGYGAKAYAMLDDNKGVDYIILESGGEGYENPVVQIIYYEQDLANPATATATATATDVDAAVFTGTNDDFVQRTRTTAGVIVDLDDGEYPGGIDVTDIVSEIIENDNWDTGDNLGIFIGLYQSPNSITGTNDLAGREIHSWDEDAGCAGNCPELEITWSEDVVPVGSEHTCAQEVFVSNKHNKAPVQYIYVYDNPGGFGSNVYGWDFASTLDLLPAVPAVGDAIYFGAIDGPFCSLVFDLYERMADVAGLWEYWDGADWADFVVDGTSFNELCGDQIYFSKLGVGSIVWKPPWDWATKSDGGDAITAYWVRFRVTSVGGAPAPPSQQHRDIYTVLNPYIDIDAEEVPGNVPALARIYFDAATCAQRSMNMLVLGLRSLSRGSDFSAYLNASDVQKIPGSKFTVIDTYGLAGLISFMTSPTGRVLDLTGFDPYGSSVYTLTPVCSWSLSGELPKQYIGSYHAYVRCRFIDSAVGNVIVRLRAVFGDEFNVSYSEINTVSGDDLGLYNWCVIDLGQLTITPPFTIRPGDSLNTVKIYLDMYSDLSYHFDNSYVSDVILIPSDEWTGVFGMPKLAGTSVLSYGKGLDIDAITNPRQYRAAQISKEPMFGSPNTQGEHVMAEWSKIASGEPIFQNNDDQRLWFLQYKYQEGLVSYFENCGMVKTERSARYTLMRGEE